MLNVNGLLILNEPKCRFYLKYGTYMFAPQYRSSFSCKMMFIMNQQGLANSYSILFFLKLKLLWTNLNYCVTGEYCREFAFKMELLTH